MRFGCVYTSHFTVFEFSCLGLYTDAISVEARVHLLFCDRVGCVLREYTDVMRGGCVFMFGCVYTCHVI